MTDPTDDSDETLERDDADGEGGIDPADAFAALSDPVRVGILEALADHYRDGPVETGLPFSTLRRAVGVRDSGRFRYHLEKLRDRFVTQGEDGTYQLTYAGGEVATAIVAGTYTDSVALGPTELDSECTICGATAVGRYEDGVLAVRCEAGHPLFVWSLPPNAARGSTVEALVETATLDLYQTVEMTRTGVCADCYTPVEPGVEPTGGDGNPYRFHAECDACGSTLDGPLGFCLVGHPEVEALYRRHGRSIREGYWWELAFVREDEPVERVGEGPLRLQLSVTLGDETLTATVDEDANVVETDRHPNGRPR